MVGLTDEENADWMARGREELTDLEWAGLRGDVIAREGRRFLVVRRGPPDEHDGGPLPFDVEAAIFDARTRTPYDAQPLETLLAHTPYFTGRRCGVGEEEENEV